MKMASSKHRCIPFLFTAIALLLAIWPRINALINGGRSDYDPTIAVLTATLIAIIWYTYYTFETLQHARTRDAEERQRGRESLASGVLAELRWLEESLEQVYMYGPFLNQDNLGHPLLLQAISQSTLFEPVTVGKLSRFLALLRDVRSGVNECRANPSLRGTSHGSQLKELMRAKAGFAMQALPEICTALVAEGGVLETRVLTEPLNAGELPSLPPSPFGPRRLTDGSGADNV